VQPLCRAALLFSGITIVKAQGKVEREFFNQAAARLWPAMSQKISSPKSYPSRRPCPDCGEKTLYQASWSTLFTGLYTRTCLVCGFCDSRKVKMIRQL
jgi:predicted RNA-binding Zn-ribbon protein involved in translation (DUF1610 family)